MTWTYSGDPASSQRDQVRFYCQDTNEPNPLLQDEEIDFLLLQWVDAYDSALYAAAVACEVIAAKFAQFVDVSADGVTVGVGALTEKYNTLAASLRDQYKALFGNTGPLLEDALHAAGETDPSIPALTFAVGFQDNYWAGKQDYGDRGEYTEAVEGVG